VPSVRDIPDREIGPAFTAVSSAGLRLLIVEDNEDGAAKPGDFDALEAGLEDRR